MGLVKGFVWRQFGAEVFFVRQLRLAHFLIMEDNMKKITQKLILIFAAILSISALFSSCEDIIGEISESIDTSEAIIELTETNASSDQTTNTTTDITSITEDTLKPTVTETESEKYPKSYDING